MLGIRHFRGCAVDLWCGDPREFACDVRLTELDEMVNHPKLHIGVQAGFADAAWWQALVGLLERAATGCLPRRVTIFALDPDHYQLLQKQLFEYFPEER